MTDKDYKSILVISLGFLGLYWWLESTYFLWATALVIGLPLISEKAGQGILWIWFKLAQVLGYINSRILLTLIFFLFLAPLAFVYRLFKADSMMLKKTTRRTTFHERNHQFNPRDLIHPW